MSREVKMVPLDFDWPLKKVWHGYLMPDDLCALECSHCKNGFSVAGQELQDRWYGYSPFRPEERGSTPFLPDGPEAIQWANRQMASAPQYYGTGPAAIAREAQRICLIWNSHWSHHLNQDDVDALVAAGRLMDLTHEWKNGKWHDIGYRPTAAEVNRWGLFGFGHDSINCHVVIEAECKRLGVSLCCSECGGSGEAWRDDEHRTQHDAWEASEPPKGNAIQMWETTSEGSPISPPFETATELARWLAETRASAFGSDTCTEEEWLAMINAGHSVASAVVMDGFDVVSGVEAVSRMGV